MQENCTSTFHKLFCYRRHITLNHLQAAGSSGITCNDLDVEDQNDDLHSDDMREVHSHNDGSTNEANMEDEEDDFHEDEEDDSHADVINEVIIAFLATLRSYGSLPYSASNEILNQVREIVNTVVTVLKRKTESVLKKLNLGELKGQFNKILGIFQDIDPIEQFSSEYKQVKYLESKEVIILPEEKVLGQRFTSLPHRNDGVAVQVLQNETYQYIPIHKLLKRLLEQPGVMSLILQQRPSFDKGIISTFRDGELVKRPTENVNCNWPVIKLLLYSDDFESANPLGSKKSLHKLCAFYINILNLPSYLQSNLHNIHLLALVKSAVLSKYGIDTVLHQFIEDLKDISENGLQLDCPDYKGMVLPQLFQVIGDNLGVHSMLGYAGSFSANFYCRFCKAHRNRAQVMLQEDASLLRNFNTYESDIQQCNLSETGLSKSSALNELRNYHVSQNISVDIMHDIFEGIAPLEVKLVLDQLINDGYFTLHELNQRITSFSYGFTDARNRPSLIQVTSLRNPYGPSGQTAAQMMCLIFNIPLIIGDKVPEYNDYWELLLLLLDIIKIIMSRSTTEEETFRLSALIRDHHGLFLKLFPAKHLTPKQHFLIHYPNAIRLLGPLQQYNSIRFEAKHKQLKLYAKVSNNFRNIPKTLAYKNQVAHAFNLLLKPHIRDTQGIEIFGQSVVNLDQCENGEKLKQLLGVSGRNDQISLLSVNSIDVQSYEFRKGTVLVTAMNDSEPEFSQIDQIFVFERKVLFLVQVWVTQYNYRHYHAYAILPPRDQDQRLIQFDHVKSQRPLHLTKSSNVHDQMYYVTTRGLHFQS